MQRVASFPAACFLVCFVCAAAQEQVYVNFGFSQDTPLFKKYAVMNSGLIDAARYNDTIVQSIGDIKAFALVADLYMGTSNGNASFRDVIGGSLATAGANGEIYNYAQLDGLTIGLGSRNVRPYWAITYNPWPFQPLTASANATGQTACLGFEDAGYPQHYSCVPYGATAFDDCWKCPPKNADGSGYSNYQRVMEDFALHQSQLNVSSFRQIWNEPDLTTYYDYSSTGTAFFHGTSADYAEMYAAAANGMLEGDPLTVVGGMGAAYWISSNPGVYPGSDRPSGSDLVLRAVNSSLPLNFFSFHVVAPCIDKPGCAIQDNGGQPTFDVRAQFARYALTQPEAIADGGRFNTTELHCTEYFPGTTAAQYGLPFTGTSALSILMLNDFLYYLDQTDVAMITWAQYMEPVINNGTGLVDIDGNARPSWHSFKFWGDLPVERVTTNSSSPDLKVVAGFNAYECRGSVLMWNNGTTDIPLSLSILNIPYATYNVDFFQLDPVHMPGPGFDLAPVLSLANQSSDASGGYAFPAAGTNFSLPVDGVAYLNVTGTDCIPTPARPSGRIIRRQSYYGFRPARTYMYGEFDHRTWTAYVGMGNETSGVALAGATVQISTDLVMNISMNFFGIPSPPYTPILGVRVDYYDAEQQLWPANSSIFFYQDGMTPNAAYQTPPLYGSEENVQPQNFFPVNLASFGFRPNSTTYPVPAGWQGQTSIILMLKDGVKGSRVQCYLRQATSNLAAVPNAATAG